MRPPLTAYFSPDETETILYGRVEVGLRGKYIDIATMVG